MRYPWMFSMTMKLTNLIVIILPNLNFSKVIIHADIKVRNCIISILCSKNFTRTYKQLYKHKTQNLGTRNLENDTLIHSKLGPAL